MANLQPHHRRRGGRHDPPHGRALGGERRLHALDRGERRTTCAASATRSRSTTAASPRSPTTSRASPTTRAIQHGAPGRVRAGHGPAAVPGRHDGHAAQPAAAPTGMEDRLPAVLEEAVRVRAEMGYPIMATPFSQLVGIQALLNVVQGERYLDHPRREPHVPRRPLRAAARGARPGGPRPGRRDGARSRDVRRLGSRRSRRSRRSAAHYGEHLSDEELLLRYLIPGPDVDAMYAAARPIEPVYPLGGPNGLGWLRRRAWTARRRARSAPRAAASRSRCGGDGPGGTREDHGTLRRQRPRS